VRAVRATVSVLIAVSLGGMTAPIVSGAETRAFLDGDRIALRDVARYHCHDAASPAIRCSSHQASRDRDVRRLAATRGVRAVFYVQVFEHENYGGASLSISTSISNLGSVGWNDAITSFKSLNGGRPKFWENSGYGGSAWQWAAGAWVANVGSGANDRFSSVKNVP
jgi:hypothetical protein